MIQIKQLFKDIYLVCGNKFELSRAMIRFQEYYESPKFHGKIFTRKEFTDWYCPSDSQKYYRDWSGFNVPHYVFHPFHGRLFKGVTKNEKKIVSYFKRRIGSHFYVIGATPSDFYTVLHELAHAMFFLSETYRREVIVLLEGYRIPIKFKKRLQKMGYAPHVTIDEFHAYLIDGEKYKELGKFKILAQRLRDNLKSFLADRRIYEKKCLLSRTK